MKRFSLLAAFLLLSLAGLQAAPGYTQDPSWPGKLPDGWKYRMVGNAAGDSKGTIYVVHRGAHPLLRFDKQGKFLGSLGDDIFQQSVNFNLTVNPPIPISREYWLHGLHVDPWDNVWVTDLGRQVVMKLSPEGKLLLTLGTLDKSGTDEKTFNQPSSVAVAPSGHIYVADGYGNSRIMKFSPEGKFLKTWGKKGSGTGEFDTPHGITVDASGKVYVAERMNNRIQVFDAEGNFLAQWPGFTGPDSIKLLRDGTFYVGTGRGNPRLFHLDPTGARLEQFGEVEIFGYPHGIHVDAEGSLYLADPVADKAARPPRKFVRTAPAPGSGK